MNKYKYSYEYTSNYCYPGSDLLINKLNIKDEVLLNKYEKELVAIRQAEIAIKPVKGDLDFEHLKAIHKYLFQDLYDWAGKTRTCNIAKKDLFCLSQLIDSYASDVFGKLKNKNYIINSSLDTLVDGLTSLFGDINALHPFREGNGRSKREFINMIARINGYELSFVSITSDDMIKASHMINNGHEEMIRVLFKKNIHKIDSSKQKDYIDKYVRNRILKEQLLTLV